MGYTFGNYIESELIGKIYEGMEIGDLLLVDARLHDFDKSDFRKLSADDKEKMLLNYRSALNNQFAFGPIETVTTAEYKTTKFEYRIDNSLTVVPNAINVITYCENLTTKFRHNSRTIRRKKIDLAFTTFYNFTSLENWFRDREFFVLWSKKISSTGIFLIKKLLGDGSDEAR